MPAVASCLLGVLLGDFVVYMLGYCYGEKVLRFPLTRRFLTRQREAQIKGYFHRHGFRILVSGRLVPGFRTAAYLTAGILKLPALRLLMTDLVAVSLSTALMFGLGISSPTRSRRGSTRSSSGSCSWWPWASGPGSCTVIIRPDGGAGQPVGPPVLDVDEVPLPPAGLRRTRAARVARRLPGPPLVEAPVPAAIEARNAGSPHVAPELRTSREPGGNRLAADSGVFDDAAVAVALTAYSRRVGETHRNHDRGRAWWVAPTLQRLLPRRPGPPRDPAMSVTLGAGIREPRRRPLPAQGTTTRSGSD